MWWRVLHNTGSSLASRASSYRWFRRLARSRHSIRNCGSIYLRPDHGSGQRRDGGAQRFHRHQSRCATLEEHDLPTTRTTIEFGSTKPRHSARLWQPYGDWLDFTATSRRTPFDICHFHVLYPDQCRGTAQRPRTARLRRGVWSMFRSTYMSFTFSSSDRCPDRHLAGQRAGPLVVSTRP